MVAGLAGVGARAVGIIDADIRPFRRALAQGLDALENFDARSASAGKGLAQLGPIAVGVGASLEVLAGHSVRAFVGFEQAVANLGAVASATAPELRQLEELALDIGENTKFTAAEAAGAMEELAKAGTSVNDILEGAARGATDLAAATGRDVSQAATIMATSMNTFNIAGTEATHVADVFAAAANKSAADIETLAAGLQQSGQVAAMFGLSFEETVAILSAFADAGLRGSDAGTSLRTMLLSMVDPTKEQAALLDDLNISFYDLNGNFIGIAKVVDQLSTKWATLTDEERDNAAAVIFGTDAIRAQNIMVSLGADGFARYVAEVNDAGAAQRMAEQRLDSTAGALEKLRGSVDTVAIQLGRGLAPAIRTTAEVLDSAADAVGAMDEDLLGAIGRMIALSGAVLLVAGGGAKLIQMGRSTAATWASVGTSLAGTTKGAQTAAATLATTGGAARTAAGSLATAGTAAATSGTQAAVAGRGWAALGTNIAGAGLAARTAGPQMTTTASGIILTGRAAQTAATQTAAAGAAIAVTGTNAAKATGKLGPFVRGLGSLAKFAGLTIAIPIALELTTEAVQLATSGGDPGFFDDIAFGITGGIANAIGAIGPDAWEDALEANVQRSISGLEAQDFAIDLGFSLDPVFLGGGPEDALIKELDLTIKEVEEFAAQNKISFDDALTGLAAFLPELKELGITWKDANEQAQAAGVELDEWLTTQVEAKKAAQEQALAQAGLARETEDGTDATKEGTDATRDNAAAHGEAGDSLLEHKKGVEQLAREELEAAQAAEDLKRRTQELANEQFLAAEAAKGIFNPFIAGAEDAAAAAEDWGQQVDEHVLEALDEIEVATNTFDFSDPLDSMNDALGISARNVTDLMISFDSLGILPLEPSIEAALRMEQQVTKTQSAINEMGRAIDSTNSRMSEHQGIISLVDETLGTAEDGYAQLNEAVAVGLLSVEEANAIWADAIFLRERAVIGLEEEQAQQMRNISALADYVRANDSAVASVGLLTSEQQGFLEAMKDSEVQTFLMTLQTLAYLDAVGAIPTEKVTEFILRSAQGDAEVGAVIDDLGLLEAGSPYQASIGIEARGLDQAEDAREALTDVSRSPFVATLDLESENVQAEIRRVHELLASLTGSTQAVGQIRIDTEGAENAVSALYEHIDETLLTPEFIAYLDANGDDALSEVELAQIGALGFERVYEAFLTAEDQATPVVREAVDYLSTAQRLAQNPISPNLEGYERFAAILDVIADDLDQTFTTDYYAFLDLDSDGFIQKAELAKEHLDSFQERWTAYLDAESTSAEERLAFLEAVISNLTDGRHVFDVNAETDQALAAVLGVNAQIDESFLTKEFLLHLDVDDDELLSAAELAGATKRGLEENPFVVTLDVEDNATPAVDALVEKGEALQRSPFVAELMIRDVDTQQKVDELRASIVSLLGLTEGGVDVSLDADQAFDVISKLFLAIDHTLITPEFIAYLDADADGALSTLEVAQLALFGFETVHTAYLDANSDGVMSAAEEARTAGQEFAEQEYDASLTYDDEQAEERIASLQRRLREIDAEQSEINISDPYTQAAIDRTRELQREREAVSTELIELGVVVNNEQALTEFDRVRARGDELREDLEETRIALKADPTNQELFDQFFWIAQQIAAVDGREAVIKASIDAAPFDSVLTLITDDLNETFGPRYTAFLDANGDGLLSETERSQGDLEGIAKRWTAFLTLYSGDTDVQIDFIQQRLNDIARPVGINVFTDASAALAVLHGVNAEIDEKFLDRDVLLYLDADNNGVLTAVELAVAAAGQWDQATFEAWLAVEGNVEEDLAETQAAAENFDNAEYQATLAVLDEATPVIDAANAKELEDKSATATVETEYTTTGTPAGELPGQLTSTIVVDDAQARADVTAFAEFASQSFATHQLLVLGIEDDLAVADLQTFQDALGAFSAIPVPPRVIGVDYAQALLDLQTFQDALGAFTIIPVEPREIPVDTAAALLELQTLQTAITTFSATPPSTASLTLDVQPALDSLDALSAHALAKIEDFATWGLVSGAAYSEQFAAGVAPASDALVTEHEELLATATSVSAGLEAAGYGAGNDFTQGVINALSSNASIVYRYAYQLAWQVYSATLNALRERSPSERAAQAMEWWVQGITTTLDESGSRVYSSAEALAANVAEPLEGIPGDLARTLGEAFNEPATALESMGDHFIGVVENVADTLRLYFDAIRDDGDWMNDWIRHVPEDIRRQVLAAGQALARSGAIEVGTSIAVQTDTRAQTLATQAQGPTTVVVSGDHHYEFSSPGVDAVDVAKEFFGHAQAALSLELSRSLVDQGLRG